MTTLLGDAGRAAIKAFAASLIVLMTGLLAAPNLGGVRAFGLAALISLIAGIAAGLQVIEPRLSFRNLIPGLAGAVADSFAHAFLGALIVSLAAWLTFPDISDWRAVATGALTGAVTAGLRAAQGLFTTGENPTPGKGLQLKGAAAPSARRLLPA